MSHTWTIAKKELRQYFLSPVALIFLALFLGVTLFWFFDMEPKFWVRNLADIRPLFSVFPVMLIFLVAALTMRLWSEEQKLGTLEVLLTLPVRIHSLVIGKFLAGIVLVAIALAMTLHVPIIVSMHGDLDWGPVIGGYVGTMLLASAYLAIGLCMSSATENQIVSLILTVVSCGIFYLFGVDALTELAPTAGAEIMRSIGTGSRFESVARGVFDVRDLLYYASLTVTFLVINTVMLHAKRWSSGARTRMQRVNANVLVWLTAANLLALNVWMHSVRGARIDITERQEFSVSTVTEGMIRGLDSPLLIRGYFSKKTHPLLAPLVPKIRDLLDEYGAISGGNVTVEWIDPSGNEELEKDAGQLYGIKSFPFRIRSKYETGVVNSYFSILIKYGDQHEVLNFGDLIEVDVQGTEPDVKLRNLEYDLTRSIKKTAYGFQTLETVFADISDEIEFTAYVSQDKLPENFKEASSAIETVLSDLKKISADKFKYEVIDPNGPDNKGMPEMLFKKFGFRPMSAGLFSQETFYLHLLLRVGDRYERIVPPEGMSEADLRKEIVAALKRSTPGFLKTVGLLKPPTEAPPRDPRMPPNQPGPQAPEITQILSQKLRENYTVKPVVLKDGRVPGDIDVLLVVGPKEYDDKQQFAIDQYLMRGGSVIVLTGKYILDASSAGQQGLTVRRITSGLEDMLATYGVTVEDTMVMDPQNEKFPVPVMKNLGGFQVQQIQMVNYPYFVDVRSDGMDSTSPVLGGLPGVTLHWASPLTVSTPEGNGREVLELLKSTDGAWTRSESSVQPDYTRWPEDGFGVGDDRKSRLLAVAIHGKFDSAFANKPSPLYGADAQGGENLDRTGRTIKASPDSARLVVIGSSNFVNDMVMGISRQTGGDRMTSNLQFVENLLDWSVSDEDLLTIRSRGAFARTLMPMDPDDRALYEIVAYIVVLVMLGVIIAFTAGGRRRLRKLQLVGKSSSRAGISGEPSKVQS